MRRWSPSLLPPERRELARRAWPAIERANPGLPGVTCELAADLAHAAGEPSAAAALLVESARRAVDNGALATAETTARRARHLAGDDDAAALDADEVLVHVLAAAGKPLEALALGNDAGATVRRRRGAGARRADLLVALARAAVAGADLDTAARVADEARTLAERDGSPALMAQIDATAAEVALELADLARAERAGAAGDRGRRGRRRARRPVRGPARVSDACNDRRDWPPPIGRSSGRPTSPRPPGSPSGTSAPARSWR